MKKSKYILLSFLLVLFLTALTLKVSFSYISNINSNTKLREITSGNLSISLNVKELKDITLKRVEKLPVSENDKIEGEYSEVKITNNGNLKSKYDVYINYDLNENDNKDNYLSFKYLLIGIYDKDNKKWVKFNDKYYLDFENILNEDNNYKILSNTIKEREDISLSHNYYIYVWLKDSTPKSEIGKIVKLKIDVESIVDN